MSFVAQQRRGHGRVWEASAQPPGPLGRRHCPSVCRSCPPWFQLDGADMGALGSLGAWGPACREDRGSVSQVCEQAGDSEMKRLHLMVRG